MNDELRNRVAMVTGAGRGVGRAIAQALAQAGAAVGVMARTEAQVAETVGVIGETGGKALAVIADVSDAASVESAARQVEGALGPVDVLVNNAAIMGPLGPMWDADADDWWHSFEVNLRGPYLCSRALLPGMIARRRGRIINLSTSAATVAVAHMGAYVVAKTALIRFTENLAAELLNSGVSVFAIDPGTVRTAMSQHLLESEAGKTWLPWFRKLFDKGRDVPAGQAAQLVVELASGKADALSGRFLGVADDLTKLLEQLEEVKRSGLYTLRVRKL
ncbi:Short-chain dehydrogenase/reductase SDR [Acidobacteriia bacterium SbA2]|nr:Short-chain dehydrogenase/reductase SDR [Acidobacteriia bacterium SbA2]